MRAGLSAKRRSWNSCSSVFVWECNLVSLKTAVKTVDVYSTVIVKAVYALTHRVQSLLCSADRQVLFTDKASNLSHWSEHFQYLFSSDHVIQDLKVLHIPQQPFKAELDELLSMKEISKAMGQLRSGKAAGLNKIPPELWKEE